MKKLTLLLLTFFSFSVLAQTETETIKKANEYITAKKYETAFDLLNKFDPDNNKPNIVLLKEDILLKYFVTSIMHQLFALKDLKKNENISDYRGKNGNYQMFLFPADSILTRLIKKNPKKCKLYYGLGNYYYEVLSKYGGNWLKNDKELLQLIQTNFQKTIDKNCADYYSYYILGYINLIQNKYKESIPYLVKSVEMNDKYPTATYNLAYAYLYTDDYKKALKYAKNSINLYDDDAEYKSDAARMTGQIYIELNDDNNARKYFEMADKIDPNNYYNIQALLNIYLKTNNSKAKEMAKTLLNFNPENPDIYNDLEKIYDDNGKLNDLIDFFKSQFYVYKNNIKVQGILNFYLADIYLDKDKKTAKKYFIKAKQNLEKVLNKDNPVFEIIDKGIEQCKK